MKWMLKVTFDAPSSEVVKQMPTDAEIRHVSVRDGLIVVFFETEFEMDSETARFEARRFAIRPTGYPIPEGATYVDTVLVNAETWHVYDRGAA